MINLTVQKRVGLEGECLEIDFESWTYSLLATLGVNAGSLILEVEGRATVPTTASISISNRSKRYLRFAARCPEDWSANAIFFTLRLAPDDNDIEDMRGVYSLLQQRARALKLDGQRIKGGVAV